MTYRNCIISLIKSEVRAMKYCRKHPVSGVNDLIFDRNQAQASVLLGLIEMMEKIKPESRSDELENMIIRLDVLKEKFNA